MDIRELELELGLGLSLLNLPELNKAVNDSIKRETEFFKKFNNEKEDLKKYASSFFSKELTKSETEKEDLINFILEQEFLKKHYPIFEKIKEKTLYLGKWKGKKIKFSTKKGNFVLETSATAPKEREVIIDKIEGEENFNIRLKETGTPIEFKSIWKEIWKK